MRVLLSMTVALFAPLALAEAPQGARPAPTLPSEADAKALVATAAKGFRDTLKESSSAEFRSTFVMATTGRDGHLGYSLCGEIKAKNAEGAVAGWHQFVA